MASFQKLIWLIQSLHIYLNYDKRLTMFNTFRDLTAYRYLDQDENSTSEVDIMHCILMLLTLRNILSQLLFS